jgi:hypothetical protein
MDSTNTIIAVAVASTALFLGFLGWKLAWFLRKVAEQPRDTGCDAASACSTEDCATGLADADRGDA